MLNKTDTSENDSSNFNKLEQIRLDILNIIKLGVLPCLHCILSYNPLQHNISEINNIAHEYILETVHDSLRITELLKQILEHTFEYNVLSITELKNVIFSCFQCGIDLNTVAWIKLHSQPWELADIFFRNLYGLSSGILSLLCCLFCVLTCDSRYNVRNTLHADNLNYINKTSLEKESYDIDDFMSQLNWAFYYADMGRIMSGPQHKEHDLFFGRIQCPNPIQDLLHSLLYNGKLFAESTNTSDIIFDQGILKQLEIFLSIKYPCYENEITKHSFAVDNYIKPMGPNESSYMTKDYIFSVNPRTHLWEVTQKCIISDSVHYTHHKDSLLKTTVPIIYSKTSSLDIFMTQYLHTKTPVLMREGCSHWPAIIKWRDIPRRLLACGRRRLVPVEIGTSYTGDSWSQKLMTVEQFVSTYLLSTTTEQVGYIAQHPMLDQMPELQNELLIPDEAIIGETDVDQIIRLIWIGPGSTVSPFHTDRYDNIFTQISGFKFIRLISSKYTHEMYPYESLLTNTSSITPSDILRYPVTLQTYPEYPNEESMDVILGPGDQLFIPAGWWHYVTSLTPSVSVSNWFTGGLDSVTQFNDKAD